MVVELAPRLRGTVPRVGEHEDLLVSRRRARAPVEGIDAFFGLQPFELEVRVAAEPDPHRGLGVEVVVLARELEASVSAHEGPVDVTLTVRREHADGHSSGEPGGEPGRLEVLEDLAPLDLRLGKEMCCKRS